MKNWLKILIAAPFLWIIGYFLGGMTVSGLNVFKYANYERLITVFLFLILVAGFVSLFFQSKNNKTKKFTKNNYIPKTNTNINIKQKLDETNKRITKVSNQIEEISNEEDEEIYTLVSREVSSDDRKEGSWAKALILSDGDENKAKIEYMKLRVEILKKELIEKKIQNKFENEEKTKQYFLNTETNFKTQLELLNKRRELDTNEEKIPIFGKSNLAGSFQIEVNLKSGYFAIPETYTFSIFLDLKKDSSPYYWINELGEKKYFETLNLAKDDIRVNYEEFISNIKLLKEHKNR